MNATSRYKLYPLIILVMILIIATQPSFAQTHIELTPSLSIRGEHDDNIYLSPSNEVSSYITMISPGFNFSLLKQDTDLMLEYTPTFVWYDNNDVDSTTRHRAALDLGQSLSHMLRLSLADTYIESDEPLEETEGVEGARHTRNSYQRNIGDASLRYLFGPENTLTVGYRHELLYNEDDRSDDGRTHHPFATMAYFLNAKNSLEMEYGFTKAHFWNDELPAGDDYRGHEAGLKYIYSFTPHKSATLGYDLTTRQFDGNDEDYRIHSGMLGFEQGFSPDFSVSASAGYFIVDNEYSDTDTGYSYDASMNKQFKRGSINIGGSGGWDESYLEADRRGLTRYYSTNASGEYQILEPLTGYANAFYRHDKDADGRQWDTVRGGCGLRWDFLRWYSLGLDYTYAERDDDEPIEDYKDNRVAFVFTVSRLYRW